jgi:acyl-CoA synthetase (AMP-forming)/AMP-acid ligase II
VTTTSVPALAERLRAVLTLDPSAPAVEFDGRWWSWGELGEIADRVGRAVAQRGAPIGVLLRNTPYHVGAVLGVLIADGCLVTINPGLGDRTRADLAELDLALLAGTAEDLAQFGPSARAGVATLALDAPGEAPSAVPHVVAARPGVAVLMLTSGTTGPPKRVELGADTVLRTMAGARHYESSRPASASLRSGVAIVNSPLVHLGGLFRVVQCVLDGRSFVLLPRFDVAAWADAVRRHRPQTASLVPTALRMVLESDLTREDLSSLRSVVSGTAPLDPADAEAFTARFGVPVLTSYAATEFGGGVAGWNLADYHEFAATKRGSVGRAHAGCGLRVVDEAGAPCPTGTVGALEVRPAQFGPDAAWVRTTDLAHLDDDGFLWIVGRADQTIIRGGFKVQPDTVRAALERLPAVRCATVFGVADPRLGEVPAALVELRSGMDASADELLGGVAGQLARYELPAHVQIVEALPRTASGKVDLAAARAMVRP